MDTIPLPAPDAGRRTNAAWCALPLVLIMAWSLLRMPVVAAGSAADVIATVDVRIFGLGGDLALGVDSGGVSVYASFDARPDRSVNRLDLWFDLPDAFRWMMHW